MKYSKEQACHKLMIYLIIGVLNIFQKLIQDRVITNCILEDEDVPKIAFRTRYGHLVFFCYAVSLTNALAVFMDLKNWVFRNYLDQFILFLLMIFWVIPSTSNIFELLYRPLREQQLMPIETNVIFGSTKLNFLDMLYQIVFC